VIAFAEGGYLVAIATGSHAAPATMVGASSVVEPEDAVGAYESPDERLGSCWRRALSDARFSGTS
jgi:hypothetical protein